MRIRIQSVFGIAFLQDAGRPGFRKYGVPVGGAFDKESMRLVNGLLGNDPDATVIEFALGTMEIEAIDAGCLAVVGAAENVIVNGAAQEIGRVVRLNPGDLLTIVPPRRGLRTYIAACSGFDVVRILSSASGIAVERGAELSSVDDRDIAAAQLEKAPSSLADRPLRVMVPSDDSWCGIEYRVSRNIDRVGLRFEGPKPMIDARAARSEPSVFGAVQLTEDRTLIVHGPDGPTIGGYVKIGCVVRADLDRLGQLAPGDAVRFERIGGGV